MLYDVSGLHQGLRPDVKLLLEPERSLKKGPKTGADMYSQSCFNGQVIGPLGCGVHPIGSL